MGFKESLSTMCSVCALLRVCVCACVHALGTECVRLCSTDLVYFFNDLGAAAVAGAAAA